MKSLSIGRPFFNESRSVEDVLMALKNILDDDTNDYWDALA